MREPDARSGRVRAGRKGRGRALLLPAILCAGVGLGAHARAQGAGAAYLSWSADERVTNLPALAAPEAAVYLTVETPQPIDSLGFDVRWASRRPDARVEVLGLRGVARESSAGWRKVAGDEQGVNASFHPLDTWLSDPGCLAAIREELPGGGARYRLAIALAAENLGAAQIQIAGLAARLADGTTLLLGSPAVSVDSGWVLRQPPLIRAIEGALNWRFLQSRLRIEGADLDRLSDLVVVDSARRRFRPVRIESRSPELLEVTFANRTMARGPARLVYRDADCVTDSLPQAIEIEVFEEQRPGDTNLGVVPGRE